MTATQTMKCDNKVLIFTQFSTMAYILERELKEYMPLIIAGDVSTKERQERVELFNNDPKYKIMILTEAGGVGLNLQAASYVVHYDAPWSIAKLMQREDRAHRIGQKKPVTVYNLIARNTIDEYVVKVLYKKQKISVDILKDDERLEDLGMSEEDIKSILRL